MTFSIEHDFDDLFERMNNEKIFNENTFTSILKKAAKPLEQELLQETPRGIEANWSAKANNIVYRNSIVNSRLKYGELYKALGVYKNRRMKMIGEHAVNVGYLSSKQDKAFVAHFFNFGWRNAKSGRMINTPHQGWMQKAENKTYPQMKVIFDKEVTKVFEEEIAKKWAKSKMRKKK